MSLSLIVNGKISHGQPSIGRLIFGKFEKMKNKSHHQSSGFYGTTDPRRHFISFFKTN